MHEVAISSHAFTHGGAIPELHSMNGGNRSPPLHLDGIDPRAESWAIIVDDPDIPIPFLSFTHWLIYDLPLEIVDIEECIAPVEVIRSLGGALQGRNGFGRIGYVGPNPPFGVHTYRFMVYVLDCRLGVAPGIGRRQLERSMAGHILQRGLLEGKYGYRKVGG